VTTSFFLMHEIPDDYKTRAITNLLKCVKKGGKVVFIDYHKPKTFSIFRLIMPIYFKIVEPYAMPIWYKELMDWTDDKELLKEFEWKKETFFFDLYQKVVAVRKKN